jgi:VRR-NUC domain
VDGDPVTATHCRPRYPGQPRRRPNQREHREQAQVFAWQRGFAALFPVWSGRWLFATQNGLRTSALQAVMAKRSGLTAGIPDLVLVHASHGYAACWIELKAPPTWDADGRVVDPPGKLTDEQRAWILQLNQSGHYATVAYGAAAAIACLRWYLGESMEWVCRDLSVVCEFPRDLGSRWMPVRPARTAAR